MVPKVASDAVVGIYGSLEEVQRKGYQEMILSHALSAPIMRPSGVSIETVRRGFTKP